LPWRRCEVVETTFERLAIERHKTRAGIEPGMVQAGRMLAKIQAVST
jgi:hypothetical protein